MNKKVQKLLSVLLIVFAILTVTTNVFAAPITPSQVQADTDVKGVDTIQKVGNQAVGILQTIGVILSVVILIFLGIKYMMGSAEEKAEYKKTFIPYVVGAALIFAASVFAQSIYDIFYNMTSK